MSDHMAGVHDCPADGSPHDNSAQCACGPEQIGEDEWRHRSIIELEDAALLIRADSLLSLVRYRESRGLAEQTIRDLDELLPKLRRRTDEIIRTRRGAAS